MNDDDARSPGVENFEVWRKSEWVERGGLAHGPYASTRVFGDEGSVSDVSFQTRAGGRICFGDISIAVDPIKCNSGLQCHGIAPDSL